MGGDMRILLEIQRNAEKSAENKIKIEALGLRA
jgi:hypothetical protein